MIEGQRRRHSHWREDLTTRERGTVKEEAIQCEYQVRRQLLKALGLDSFRHFGVAAAAMVAIVLSL